MLTYFKSLCLYYVKLKHKNRRIVKKGEKHYSSELEKLWKSKHPRKKYDRKKLVAKYTEDVETLVVSLRNIYVPLTDKIRDKLKALEDEMKRVTDFIDPTPFLSSRKRKVSWIYKGAYSSQGWGQDKYYKGAMGQELLKFQIFNIPAEANYETGYVYANVDSYGKMFFSYYYPPLKEEIRYCIKNHINPRVYNPFLPYDIERQLGLDQWGNDIENPG